MAEPDLTKLLDALAGQMGGPEAGDAPLGQFMAERSREHNDRLQREAELFRDVFLRSEDGRKVLEILLDMTLRRLAWPVWHVSDPQMLMAIGIWREAENAFVAAILQAMARGEPDEEGEAERSP